MRALEGLLYGTSGKAFLPKLAAVIHCRMTSTRFEQVGKARVGFYITANGASTSAWTVPARQEWRVCSVFGPLIVAYLFAGGAGAAASAVLGIVGIRWVLRDAELFARDGARFVRVRPADDASIARASVGGFAVALVFLAVGVACLLLDVGRLDNLAWLFVPKPAILTFGSYALCACMAGSLAAGAFWAVKGPLVARALFTAVHAIVVVAGACVVGYTSVLLASMPSIPLWNSPLVAVLFALSSTSCGLALVLGSVQFVHARGHASGRFGRHARTIAIADVCCILLEAAVFALFAAWSLATSVDSTSATAQALAASARAFLFGGGSVLLWTGFVAVGLAAPIALDVAAACSRRAVLPGVAASACVLTGGAVLRWCVITAGAHPVIGAGSVLAG